MIIHNFPADVLVAIPAYRAEKELTSFLPNLTTIIPASQVAVLIDGEYDNTREVCKKNGVQVYAHKENRGKGAALSSIFSELYDKCSWIITMDADGQHAPEDLPGFLSAIESAEKSDSILVGSRPRNRSTMPLLRRFSNGTTSGFISLVIGQKVNDSQCGYRAYRSEFLSDISCESTRFEMESEILIRSAARGHTFKNVTVSTNYNGETSHISHVKDTLRWISAVFKTMIAVKKDKK